MPAAGASNRAGYRYEARDPHGAGRILLLASGPVMTPDKPSPQEERFGYPQERRADVWVLSTVTPPADSKPR